MKLPKNPEKKRKGVKLIIGLTIAVLFGTYFFAWGYVEATNEWKAAYISEVQFGIKMTDYAINQSRVNLQYWNCELHRRGILEDNESLNNSDVNW